MGCMEFFYNTSIAPNITKFGVIAITNTGKIIQEINDSTSLPLTNIFFNFKKI